jgi:hypothetical protein
VLLGAALVALLLAGGVLGWLSGRGGAQSPPALPRAMAPAAPSVQAAVEWSAVLDDLDAARAQAFSTGELTALSAVYAQGSTGLMSDTALLQGLVDQRQTAHGLRHEVRSVDVLEETGDAARLRVVDVLNAYEVRDAAGVVVNRAPARGEQTFLVWLSRSVDGWRLVEVRPEG